MFCKNCGKELSADEKFCSGCGQKQVEEATKEEVAKPKTTKKSTPPPASKKPVVATEKTEETTEKEVVTEKVVQVENKESGSAVIEVAPQVKPEATEEKGIMKIKAVRNLKYGVLIITNESLEFKSRNGKVDKKMLFSEIESVYAKGGTTILQIKLNDETIEEICVTDEDGALKLAESIRKIMETGLSGVAFDDAIKKMMVQTNETETEMLNIWEGGKSSEKEGFLNLVKSKLKWFITSILPGKKEGITPKEQKRNRIIAVCLVVAIIFCFGGSGPSDNDLIGAAQTVIRKQLNSPSTARFYNCEVAEKDEYGRALVTMEVEAQNLMGGYKRYNCAVVIISYDTSTDEFVYSPSANQMWESGFDFLSDTIIENEKEAADWGEPIESSET